MAERGGKPAKVGDAVSAFLKDRGLEARVLRGAILVEWESVVGPQIAGVTRPRQVTEDGVLFVGVSTHAWMTELSLMETQLLARINARPGHEPIRRIRWELAR